MSSISPAERAALLAASKSRRQHQIFLLVLTFTALALFLAWFSLVVVLVSGSPVSATVTSAPLSSPAFPTFVETSTGERARLVGLFSPWVHPGEVVSVTLADAGLTGVVALDQRYWMVFFEPLIAFIFLAFSLWRLVASFQSGKFYRSAPFPGPDVPTSFTLPDERFTLEPPPHHTSRPPGSLPI